MPALGILGLLGSAAAPAFAYDLPAELPERKPGLWEMIRTGTFGPNRIETAKRYCLGAKTDLVLQETEIQSRELSVIYSDVQCKPPVVTRSGNVVNGAMSCEAFKASVRPTGKDFSWKISYLSSSEVVVDEVAIAHNIHGGGEDRSVQRQTWVGACPEGQKPGDGVEFRPAYNGGKSEKPRSANLFESRKVLTKMLNEANELNSRLH